jgi:hypothetical protein
MDSVEPRPADDIFGVDDLVQIGIGFALGGTSAKQGELLHQGRIVLFLDRRQGAAVQQIVSRPVQLRQGNVLVDLVEFVGLGVDTRVRVRIVDTNGFDCAISSFGVVISNGPTMEFARSAGPSAPRTLVRIGYRPSKKTARLVEHAGIDQVLRNRIPALAISSMFGVAGGSRRRTQASATGRCRRRP